VGMLPTLRRGLCKDIPPTSLATADQRAAWPRDSRLRAYGGEVCTGAARLSQGLVSILNSDLCLEGIQVDAGLTFPAPMGATINTCLWFILNFVSVPTTTSHGESCLDDRRITWH